jgi:hypothetical protein
MQENIQNIFIRVIKNPIMLINGKVGWQRIIKKISVVNNTIKTAKINVFMLNENEEKHYIDRNILVVPKTKLELFNNKSIILERKDRIFIESIKKTDIDIFCDYIEKSIIIKTVDVLFTDQHGDDATIKHSITDLSNILNNKIIRFEENEDYLNLKPIEFSINDNQIIVSKNNNNFDVISEYGCVNSSDSFTVNLFHTFYENLDNVNHSCFFKVDIVGNPDEIWSYQNLTLGTTITPVDQNEFQIISFGCEYKIEMEPLEGFEIQSVTFTPLRNNFYEFSFDLDNNLENTSSVVILKSDFMSNYDSLGIRWRIVNETSTLNYEDILEDLEPGTYTIEIQKLDGFFDTITDTINVYEHQRTYYKINNELVWNTTPQSNFIFPEKVTIAIDVIKKPVLSVTFEPSGSNGIDTKAQWRLLYPFGVISDWKDIDDKIKISPEILYQIEFSEIDRFVQPSNYNLILPITAVSKKIQAVYTEMLVNHIEINFIIPNKYSKYLSWCLVKPDSNQEIFIVDWNNSISYTNILQSGKYQIKIKEVIFGKTIEQPIYDLDTNILIPTQILITGENIDITLNEDTLINHILITNPE